MALTLLVIRHGEAEGNHEHRFIGQSDVPLSDLGRRQADTVGAYLASKGVTRIVSSDLQRAVNTAQPLADRLGFDIEIDVRLREIQNGEWAMHLPGEIEAGWPDLWRRYRSGEDVQRPGGETWGAVGVRVREALEELTRTGDGTIAAFCHGGPTLWAAYWAMGVQLDVNLFHGPLHPAANASITSIAVPGPKLLSFNETAHLPLDLAPESDLLPFLD